MKLIIYSHILVLFLVSSAICANSDITNLSPRTNLNISEYLNRLMLKETTIEFNSAPYQNLRKIVRSKFSKALKDAFAKDKLIFNPQLKIGANGKKELSKKLLEALNLSTNFVVDNKIETDVWPRDQYTTIGGRKIAREESEIGEGGTFVWSNQDRFILASEEPPTKKPFTTEQDKEDYQNKVKSFAGEIGFKVYFIQPEDGYGHIDTSIGIIDKYKIILVTPGAVQFYNDEVLKEIAKNEGYTIIETEHQNFDKSPSNLINIGSELYLFNHSQETINTIIAELKKINPESNPSESFINLEIDSVRQFSSFGIRCMSNVDYPILDFLNSNANFSSLEIEAFILTQELFLNNFMNAESDDTILTDEFIDNLVNELLLKSILKAEIAESSKSDKLKIILNNFKTINNEAVSRRIAKLLTGEDHLNNLLPNKTQPEQTSV